MRDLLQRKGSQSTYYLKHLLLWLRSSAYEIPAQECIHGNGQHSSECVDRGNHPHLSTVHSVSFCFFKDNGIGDGLGWIFVLNLRKSPSSNKFEYFPLKFSILDV